MRSNTDPLSRQGGRVSVRATVIDICAAALLFLLMATCPAATGTSELTEPTSEMVLHEPSLRLVLFFDQPRTTKREHRRLARELGERLRRGLPAGVAAAVAVYDGGIRMRQPFTSDRARLAEAVVGLSDPGATAEVESANRQRLIQEIDQIFTCDPSEGPQRCSPGVQSSSREDARRVLSQAQAHILDQDRALQSRLEALTLVMRATAGLPGRKALLYVASGLDLQPGRELLDLWDSKFGALLPGRAHGARQTAAVADADARLERMLEIARAGRVTIHAIAALGGGRERSVSAAEHRLNLPQVASARGDRTWDAGDEAAYRSQRGTGVDRLTSATGGQAVLGSRDCGRILDGIGQDADDIAPAPTPSPHSQAIDRTLAALLFGVAHNPLEAEFVFEPTQPPPDGKGAVLPLQLKVPMMNIAWDETESGYRGRLTVFVATQDEAGAVSPIETIEVPIEVPRDEMVGASAGYGGYRFGLRLWPGRLRFAIGVRDEIADTISVVTAEHDVRTPEGL